MSELEERVGTSWLNKIGITILVIGLGWLLNYVIPHLSKGGKIGLAYTLCAVLLGLGVKGEKSDRYRNIARVVLGGGWAATYATTYALSNWEAVKVVGPAVGFVLLFLVAAGIVAHSLRYNSQVVTGFAYVLGFATVVLGKMTVGTMAASALLAASMVVILWRRRWYWLEPVGIAATYSVHWLWLRQVFEGLLDRKQFAQFGASVALLTFYWALFTASHFLRSERERQQRLWLVGAFLLNAGGYLAVMHYQSIHPELRVPFLLGLGAVYLVLCAISRQVNRRVAFVLGSTLGSALLLVAAFIGYSDRVEFLWLLEAEVLLFLGWRLAEPHLRNLGWGVAAALLPWILYHDLAQRFTQWEQPNKALGLLLLGLGIAYLANERFVARLLRNDATEIDTTAASICAPVATTLLLAASWVALPFMWVAVVWAVLALLLWEYGRWMDDQLLRGCGHAAAAMALFRLFFVNLQQEPAVHEANLRVWTVAIAAALAYVCARRLRSFEKEPVSNELMQQFFGRGISAVYAWAGTTPVVGLVIAEFSQPSRELTWSTLGLAVVAVIAAYPITVGLLMTAAWLALPFMWVAVAWMAIALGVSELGLRRKDRVLRVCGHIAALLAAARLLIINMQYAPQSPGANLRVITVALAVTVYYLFARRISPAKSEPELETPITDEIVWRGGMPAVYTWIGTVLAGLLIWYEVTPAAVGLAWAMLGLALVEVSRPLADRALRAQGYTLMVLSFGRIFIADLNVTSDLGPVPARLVTVTLLAAIYYYSSFTADQDLPRLKTALLWFGTSALVALMYFQCGEWVSVAWAVSTVTLFFLGKLLKRPHFVYQSYLLTLLGALHCAFEDFYLAHHGRTTVSLVAVLFYFLLGTSLFEKRKRAAQEAAGGAPGQGKFARWVAAVDTHPQHLFFFVPTILVTVLLLLEVNPAYLTAAWGAEGVVVFLIALRLGERAFRLFSLGLLMLSVGRLFYRDVWEFDQLGRIISFMGLGAAMLLVSFLYTRYRDAWKKYL